MTINCGIIGVIPYDLTPGDEFLASIDISTWLGSETISAVTYSAKDESGNTVTTCYDSDSSEFTNTMIKPYIKAPSTDDKTYFVKALVTTVNSYKKAFYISFRVKEKFPS